MNRPNYDIPLPIPCKPVYWSCRAVSTMQSTTVTKYLYAMTESPLFRLPSFHYQIPEYLGSNQALYTIISLIQPSPYYVSTLPACSPQPVMQNPISSTLPHIQRHFLRHLTSISQPISPLLSFPLPKPHPQIQHHSPSPPSQPPQHPSQNPRHHRHDRQHRRDLVE